MTQILHVTQDVDSFSEMVNEIIKRGIAKDAHDLVFAIYKLVDMKYKREIEAREQFAARLFGKAVGDAIGDIAKIARGAKEKSGGESDEKPPSGEVN